jgi:hypothetical protein
VAGGQGVGVVGAVNAQVVGEKLLEGGDGADRVPGLTTPVGQIVAGGQGVGVVWTQHPQPVVEKLLDGGDGAGRVPGPTPKAGQIVRRRGPVLLPAGPLMVTRTQ